MKGAIDEDVAEGEYSNVRLTNELAFELKCDQRCDAVILLFRKLRLWLTVFHEQSHDTVHVYEYHCWAMLSLFFLLANVSMLASSSCLQIKLPSIISKLTTVTYVPHMYVTYIIITMQSEYVLLM